MKKREKKRMREVDPCANVNGHLEVKVKRLSVCLSDLDINDMTRAI